MTEALAGRLKAALAPRYAIEREIGQGGMATVFLAGDLRHDRKVALKVLRPELAALIGAERFLQEIRLTANLQHPHILPLHDSGEAEGFLYYVMPYVEGESLRDLLGRERHLPVEDALRIATQVAAALSYAHGRGVIHRDIKPENILLTSGAAIVADFGIARAVSNAGAGRLTETGLSLGTPQYMSPEQATANQNLDGRSDIYALGCVLYEALAGEPPYTGPTAQSVIAKVLTEAPRPVRNARPSVPDHVEAAIQRALAKLPADRFRTAAEFAEALATPGVAPAPALTGARPMAEAGGGGLRSRHVVAAGGVLLLALALGLAGWLRRTPERPSPVVRLVLELPDSARIQAGVGLSRVGLALSPDGAALVYRGPERLFVRRLDQIDPVPLPNTEGAVLPFFSPDGQHVGFYARGSVKRVALAGGPAVTLSSASDFAGGTWGPGDVIVFAGAGDLFRVAATGGPAERIVTSDTVASRSYRWPEFLPDGRRLLVTLAGTRADHVVGLLDLRSGHVAPVAGLGEWSTHPRFVEPGWLTYLGPGGTIFAAPFDWRAGRVTGSPIPVLENVDWGVLGDVTLGLSRNGWAVYLEGGLEHRRLTLVDRRGTARPLPVEPRPYSDPRFAPDGRHIAATILRSLGRGYTGDIWVFDLRQATLSRLTFEGVYQYPEWSGDGRRLVFTQFTAGAAETPASGGPVTTLFQGPNVFEATLTRDERTIVYRANGIPGDLYYVRRDSLDHPHAVVASPFDERSLALSPDDRWLAYVSDESGRNEVYVRPFPEGAERWQISVAGGTEPRWRRDGRELFYRNADTVLAAALRLQPEFSVGQRVALFRGDYVANARHAGYDVHPNGQEFVFVTAEPAEARDLILVQNLLSAARAPRARVPGR
ncbi:MAG TPA: protein kinase [Gemmatimonadales bacterium]|nr:protein kinase [Gemmatimonadales bacterium]